MSNSTQVMALVPCIKPTADTSIERLKDLLEEPLSGTIIILCPLGLVLNILTITATVFIPNGQKVHSRLIISLALSDILIVIGVCFHFLLFVIYGKMQLLQFAMKKSIVDVGFFATLSNLLIMAVDHYLAIVKPLEYNQLMTTARGHFIIFVIWTTSLLGGMADFLVTIYTRFEWQHIVTGATLLVFLLIVIVYTRIYIEVRTIIHRSRDIHREEMHDTKAIVTTSFIIATFFLCWMPNCLYNIFMTFKVKSDPTMFEDCQTRKLHRNLAFVFFIPMITNTLCDPLIYATRLKMVQQGYKRFYYKLFRKHSSSSSTRTSSMSLSERRNTSSTIRLSNSSQENEIRQNKEENNSSTWYNRNTRLSCGRLETMNIDRDIDTAKETLMGISKERLTDTDADESVGTNALKLSHIGRKGLTETQKGMLTVVIKDELMRTASKVIGHSKPEVYKDGCSGILQDRLALISKDELTEPNLGSNS